MLKHLLSTASVLFVSTLFPQERTALLEVLTSSACGSCTGGITYSEQMLSSYSGDLLVVNVHTDGMSPAEYVSATGLAGGSVSNCDRSANGLPLCQWCVHASQDIFMTTAPADVAVSRTYDPATRSLTVNVSAHFTSNAPAGDYRLSGIVVEDHITNGPAQLNSYAGSALPQAGIFADLPSVIPGSQMVYDHVGRALLGGYNGVGGVIPSSPQAGQTYSHTFTYTIPEAYNANYVRVYGVLINGNTGAVLNTHASNYATGNNNQPPVFYDQPDTMRVLQGEYMNVITHARDPESDPAIITAVGPLPAWATFSSPSDQTAMITGTPDQGGTYSFTFQATDEYCGTQTTRTRVLVVEPVYDPWTLMGTAGFTTVATVSTPGVALDATTNALYTVNRSNDGKVKVHRWDGSSWSSFGNQYTTAGAPVIATHPVNGKPWVASPSAADEVKVMRFNGSAWVQVNDVIPASTAASLKFSSDGSVYVATSNSAQGMMICTSVNGAWTALGGNVPISIPDVDDIGTVQMELMPGGDPVIAFTGHHISTDSTFIYAARWNGTAWELLGGGSPYQHHTTRPFKFHVSGDGVIYLAIAHPSGANVYTPNGSDWTLYCSTPEPWQNTQTTFDMVPGNDGRIFINYRDMYNRVNTRVFDGTSWSSAGNFCESGLGTLFMMPDGLPINVYADSQQNNRLTARSLSDWATSVETIEQEGATAPLLYPNPAGDVIHFLAAPSGPVDVLIYDGTGKVVHELRSTNGAVNIGTLASGSYTLQQQDTGRVLRFVKQ